MRLCPQNKKIVKVEFEESKGAKDTEANALEAGLRCAAAERKEHSAVLTYLPLTRGRLRMRNTCAGMAGVESK